MKPGTEITIKLPPPAYARRGGEVIAAMLEQVGIKAKLVPIEWAQWLDQVFKRSPTSTPPSSATPSRATSISTRATNTTSTTTRPRTTALYQKFTEAVDPKTQLDLVGQLQKKLADDEPNVFLFALAKVGVWNAKMRGLWENNPIPPTT